MQLRHAARVSARILLAHRLRTVLSAFSIFLGVAALVLSVGASEAARRDVMSRIAALGSNVLTVDAGNFMTMGRHLVQTRMTRTLKPGDAEALLRTFPAIVRVSGVVRGTVVVSWRSRSETVSLLGVTPSFLAIRKLRVARGRFFTAEENRGMARVAVLGGRLADDLFGSYNPVGERIRLQGAPFRVVGVTEEKGLGLGGETLDGAVFVPLRTATERVLNRGWLDSIVCQLRDSSAVRRLPPAMAMVLRRHHRIRPGRDDDFTINDPAKILAMEYQTGEMFRSLTAAVAGVSLATGGIGILAVMLMAVRERVNEIGLRRAIGARRRDILIQFLGEAVLLSGMGGVAGAVVGLAGTAAVCAVLGWPTLLPWRGTGEGLVFSLALGVAAGVYPAVRAARMAPVTALRAAG